MAEDHDGDENADDIRAELQALREDLLGETELEPMAPRQAMDLWLAQLRDPSEETIASYTYRVRPFLDYLDRQAVDDLTDVSTRHIKEFEAIVSDGNTRQSVNNQLGTLRQFLQYCRDLDAVPADIPAAVNVPELTKDDRVNTEKLITDRAQAILEKLDRFQYASREHALFLLLWRTTARIGAVRALDLADLYLDDADRERIRRELRDQEGMTPGAVDSVLADVALPFVRPRHRPPETPLKNGADGERVINITETVAKVLRNYLTVNRPDVTDDEGREPLLASTRGTGRLSKSWIRNTVYILTQPCEFGDPCPYDEDPEECVAREHGHGSKCPGSRSPHKVRTGSITHHRDRGWPIADLAEKANTSEELIAGVYDQPEQLIRGAVRREHLDRLDQ